MRLWSCPWSYYLRGFGGVQAGGRFIRFPGRREIRDPPLLECGLRMNT